MKRQLLVTVICVTYNQEKYIRKCLDSIVMQKTLFDYEIIIHDDCSTDGTVKIINDYKERYPNKIRTICETENQYKKNLDFVTTEIIPVAKGKYIAYCEGDDFWTDENKLQKQVDFLEKHPDYSVCGHAAYYAYENGNLSQNLFFQPYNISKTVPTSEVVSGWKMATNSLVYSRSARGTEIIPFRMDCQSGDFALIVYLSLKGKVYYMNDFMSAYRYQSIGSLSWKGSLDKKLHQDNVNKFIDMLYRIDRYTDYEYSDVISKYAEKELFDSYIATANYAMAKKAKAYYKKLNVVKKIKLLIRFLFPVVDDIKAAYRIRAYNRRCKNE